MAAKITGRTPRHHCMVVHAFYPLGETRVQREAEALAESDLGVDVICLRMPEERSRENLNGVNIYRLPTRRHKGQGILVQFLEYLFFFLMVFLKLTFLHIKNHYQVIQVHNLPDFLVFAALMPRLTGARIILDLHDLMPEFTASRFQTNMDSSWVRLMCWQERMACLFSHHIITVTELWRQSLIRRGLAPGKCSVVMNLAEDKFLKSRIPPIKKRNGSSFHLIYHGNLAQRNGIDIILRAVANLAPEIPSIRLTIHGKGEYLDELISLAGELRLEKIVHFSLDFMSIEKLPAFLARFDVGIVPYRSDIFTDGILPTKLMEYAALGLPAITSRTSAIKSYFDDSMVEYFHPGDSIGLAQCLKKLYQHPLRRKELEHNIQKFNQCFNWENEKARYITLVKNQSDARGQQYF